MVQIGLIEILNVVFTESCCAARTGCWSSSVVGETLPVLVHLGVRARTHPPQERLIGNESIVILRVAALLDQDVNLLSLELLTKRQQDVFKLSQHHGAVLHLVVQLQALNEVLEVAGFLGLLDVAVDWVELFQLNELLSLLLGAAQFVNHLQGWVQVEATETVTEEEHVHAGLALKVVDVKSKLCAFDILAIQIVSHFVLGGLPLSSLTTIEGEDRTEVGDCLRGLNLNPTLKMIDKLGG